MDQNNNGYEPQATQPQYEAPAPQQPVYQAPQQQYQTPQPFQQPYQQQYQQPYQQPYVVPVTNPGQGMGTAAMVLGIINIVLCFTLTFPLSFIGLPLGCVGLSKSKSAGMSNGMAVAGIVMNAIGLAGYAVLIILMLSGILAIPYLEYMF